MNFRQLIPSGLRFNRFNVLRVFACSLSLIGCGPTASQHSDAPLLQPSDSQAVEELEAVDLEP